MVMLAWAEGYSNAPMRWAGTYLGDLKRVGVAGAYNGHRDIRPKWWKFLTEFSIFICHSGIKAELPKID
jgi:hypothetical protein